MMQEKHLVYCLEAVLDVDNFNNSLVLKSLEDLVKHYGITNVYKTFDCIEGFEESISNLLYEDKFFNDYEIIYLVVEGRGNELKIDNYYYSFEEIADFFEGKLKGKLIHFANTFELNLEDETFQYFLDITGAKAISGYNKQIPIFSGSLDNLFFSLCGEYDEVVKRVEVLCDKQYNLTKTLGFVMYY